MRRSLTPRGVVAVALVAVLTAGALTWRAAASEPSDHLCAYMSEATGLYVGNPVTQMGFRIGTIESVTAEGDRVKVSFDVHSGRSLPDDVKAVLRSKSLLADRSLELVGNYHSGPRLQSRSCIPLERTATPKSLSAITGSAADFLQALTPDRNESVAEAIAGVDAALKGRGDALNDLFVHAQGAMSNPDKMVADVGTIITDLAPFSTATLENWDTSRQLLAVLPTDLAVGAHGLWDGVSAFIKNLTPLIADIYDVQLNYGNDINAMLGYGSTALRLAASRSKDIASLLESLPGVANSIRTVQGRTTFSARPPQLVLRAQNPTALCASVNRVRPTGCTVSGDSVKLADPRILDNVLAGGSR